MDLYKELLNIIKDKDRLLYGNIPSEYLSDTLGRLRGEAEALIFVKSTEEVSKILRLCHDNNINVTPRGAGTNLVGSTVPTKGGVILDFSKMNNILEIDTKTMTATVEPGILLEDFQEKVESLGLFYPPDPGEKKATIGGNISTNAGGMRAVKYGVTRDFVRGLTIVKADGTVLNVGGKNVKDASGLSLKHIIIGSEGTLAVITKCILKLIPKPTCIKSVLVPFPDLSTGLNAILKVLSLGAGPTAVEFMERSVVALGEDFTKVKYPHPEAGSYILIKFDGDESEVNSHSDRLKELVLREGAIDYCYLTKEEEDDIWKVRGALVKAVEAYSEQEPVDITVPIDKTAEFIGYVHEVSDSDKVDMISFGHAGDGNVHLCVVRGNRDQETWENVLHKAMDRVYHKAYSLGGVTSGEHGIGLSKRRYFLRETPVENLELMNAVKNAFDPTHILNDNKSYIE